MARAAAAVCKAHGWNAHSVIGHKEWQPGKIDPYGIDMDKFRARVAKHLAGSGKSSTSAGKPKDTSGKATTSGEKDKSPSSDTKSKKDEQSHATYAPFPGAECFRVGRDSSLIAAMGERLVAEGCNAYLPTIAVLAAVASVILALVRSFGE